MSHESNRTIALSSRADGPRGRKRAAVLALAGADAAELRRAFALAASFDRKPLLIAVDGGLATCRVIRRRPDLFVGDLDSTPVPPRGIPTCLYPVAKDFSDFSGGLTEARRLGATVVVVAGLLGGRLDHEWANLLEAAASVRAFAGVLAPTPRGLILVTGGTVTVRSAEEVLVSLFAVGGVAQVSLRGARYTLANRRLAPGSLGLSNVARKRITLEVHEGVAALVFPNS